MSKELLQRLHGLNEDELRRELTAILTRQRLGLVWEHSAIDRDKAVNANVVLPRLDHGLSHNLGLGPCQNLIIEGDNFDSLRLLRATHSNKVRVIYIDPPYNTGEKDWVYNDRFVGKTDRWRHSQWLEFLYQRLALARDLLTSDGVVFVSINDENRARLELLMDEVFPSRRIGSMVWRTRQGSMDATGAFSSDHEHILIYANPDFSFAGSARDETKYANPDNDPRGLWGSQMLIKSHNAKERPEAYYPIHNPETDTWYLCDPDSVWRFSSTSRPLNKKKLQADPIETIIAEKRILWPANEDTVVYGSKAEILAAIKAGTAPKEFRIYAQLKTLEKLAEKDVKVARLISYISPVEHWVGKRLGYGRPRYKRFRNSLKRDSNPLSSWFLPAAGGSDESEDFDDSVTLTTGGTSEGTALLRQIQGNKDFPYPKPLSLIKGLLSQSTRTDDIVLDFFAGSGTTGHAVLELNQEDGGQRKFILCSSVESTGKDTEKNVCRDITAERMRRVMAGYGNTTGLGGSFAYLNLDLIDPADVQLDADARQITQLLSLRLQGAAIAPSSYLDPVIVLAESQDVAALYIPNVTQEAIVQACALPNRRLLVFSTRPDTVRELLEAAGKVVDSRAVGKEIVAGQAGMEQTDLRVRPVSEETL